MSYTLATIWLFLSISAVCARELLELLVMMDSEAVWDIIDSTLGKEQ